MKRFLLLATSLAALMLPSCLQNETIVHLNKDGSGTLTEETLFGEQMVAMLAQFGALGAAAGEAPDPMADLVSETKAKARAARLGKGVTFLKAESVERGGSKGGRVTFQFADINTLKIAPGDSMKNVGPSGEAAAAAGAQAEPVSFKYADGKLSVRMPRPDPKAEPAAGPDLSEEMANPQMEAMVKEMFKGMKMSFKVVVNPGIAATDAAHRQGNTVTLVEMQFEELMKNEGALQQLAKVDHANPDAAIAALRKIEGVKFEPKEEITITVE